MSAGKAFIIAGTHSGCGKTSVSLGLMAAFVRRGLTVQPYKCGPDFIDPRHHAQACTGSNQTIASHNLDGWMLDESTNQEIFKRHAVGSDINLVEGVMGLFDGISATKDQGSTAQLAKMLGLPVILVVDARSMARSAAALVSGYAFFDKTVSIAGVIFNRVGSSSHAELLREAMSILPEIPVLGCLGRDPEIKTPSRHLGLVTPEEAPLSERYQHLADWVESTLDIDALLQTIPSYESLPPFDPVPEIGDVRIGIARDAAFNFYYEENLRMLQEAGARLVEFSPIADPRLPENLDGLYIGGGYPELYAFELGQNNKLRQDIKQFCESGKPVYAECGGFMYLMTDIITNRGRYAMSGVFPFRAQMKERFHALGYREVTTSRKSPIGPAGLIARGHEFHYSTIMDDADLTQTPPLYSLTGRKGPINSPEGFLYKQTLGSYVHLHFGSNPDIAESFVNSCRQATQE